jgi:hypothetical protein
MFDTIFAQFTHTIVYLSEQKRWCILFCCANVRAVHLEVAETLETDAFLNCLRHFANCRGYPRTIASDWGTNFIGVKRLNA